MEAVGVVEAERNNDEKYESDRLHWSGSGFLDRDRLDHIRDILEGVGCSLELFRDLLQLQDCQRVVVTTEQARNEAQRKQLYLGRVAQPNLPDYPVEPRRLRNIAATLMLGLIVWGILSILVAGVREHHDR